LEHFCKSKELKKRDKISRSSVRRLLFDVCLAYSDLNLSFAVKQAKKRKI
jgi:hypothetical protein